MSFSRPLTCLLHSGSSRQTRSPPGHSTSCVELGGEDHGLEGRQLSNQSCKRRGDGGVGCHCRTSSGPAEKEEAEGGKDNWGQKTQIRSGTTHEASRRQRSNRGQGRPKTAHITCIQPRLATKLESPHDTSRATEAQSTTPRQRCGLVLARIRLCTLESLAARVSAPVISAHDCSMGSTDTRVQSRCRG